MAIVLPSSLSVDAYAAAGRKVEVDRPDCPDCLGPMTGWSGYFRHVRQAARDLAVWVPRARCGACAATHALLPAFCLKNRLDVVESVGTAIEAVAEGGSGVRPVADRLDVPYPTVRGWVRRFGSRARAHAVAFSAVGVELGGPALTPVPDPIRWAARAIHSSWWAAGAHGEWSSVGPWRFASAVCGGTLLATNTNSPWFVIGRRRFMPPVPEWDQKRRQ
ncbi:MAG: hypothetical protein ABSB09_16910 [Acidimicrobiales bacterium]